MVNYKWLMKKNVVKDKSFEFAIRIVKLYNGKPIKDKENIPLKEDIDTFFEKEVMPFVPNAWYNARETKIGYEINFAKYFYKYQTPKSLEEITKDILAIEQETQGLLNKIINH